MTNVAQERLQGMLYCNSIHNFICHEDNLHTAPYHRVSTELDHYYDEIILKYSMQFTNKYLACLTWYSSCN